MKTARPIRAVIDLEALRHNYALARRCAPGARAWAVIKADAYGHGQWRAAEALRESADGFALLEAENAAALREAGLAQPILLLEGVFSTRDARLAVEFGLTTVIHCREQHACLQAAAAGRPLPPLYFKLNTGMNRLGLGEKDLPWLREILALRQTQGERGGEASPGVTLMTHFARADEVLQREEAPVESPLRQAPGERGFDKLQASFSGGTAEQLSRFWAMAGNWPGPVSLANSAALLRYPAAHGDWTRPGIMLYGASPFADETAAALGLRPVMTLKSRLIGVQAISVGERVGYGGNFTATAPTRVGIVACGYADGYPRHAPTGTPIAVCGRRTRTLGRVSMDMLACDVTDIPEAHPGAPVTLWGVGEGGTVPADAVAAAADTIAYELFCALAPRVPVLLAEADANRG